MCWEWAHKKHKRWGKKRIAEFYFLTINKQKPPSDLATVEHSKKKQKFQKIKNLK